MLSGTCVHMHAEITRYLVHVCTCMQRPGDVQYMCAHACKGYMLFSTHVHMHVEARGSLPGVVSFLLPRGSQG